MCENSVKPVLKVRSAEENLYVILLGILGCYQLRVGQL